MESIYKMHCGSPMIFIAPVVVVLIAVDVAKGVVVVVGSCVVADDIACVYF